MPTKPSHPEGEADVIVVGSGPAGVHAALTLLEGGMRVLMLDGGKTGSPQENAPTENFADVRRTRADQWKWFLGTDFSSISLQGLSGGLGGGQISGNRKYVADVSPEELPLSVENGTVLQSLAQGGLGAGWGAACAILEPHELTAMGLPAEEMPAYYEIVGKRIGISGPQTQPWIQSPLPLDAHSRLVAARAQRKNATMQSHHWKALQPHSAILTKDLGSRKASTLADMEYWADPGRSVYRPQYTLEELRSHPGFQYLPGIVRTVRKEGNSVIVATDTKTFQAKRCLLACNAVGTARILLESLDLANVDVPFLAKPRMFSACLNPHMLGKAGLEKRISLCQYLLLDETLQDDMPRACAQLYSYRSMLLFRLLGSMPFALPQALKAAALLSSSLMIADIRFPVTLRTRASLRYEPTKAAHAVSIRFPALSETEQHQRAAAWKSIKHALRTVHLFPVRNMAMPEGSAVHYTGTVPHAPKDAYPLTSDANGRSQNIDGVWIADASTFCALSPKPHTFTIMANACRVATKMLEELA